MWAGAYECKYLEQVDKYCSGAQRYGYTSKFKPISEVIRENDMQLWKKLVSSNSNCMNDLLKKQTLILCKLREVWKIIIKKKKKPRT